MPSTTIQCADCKAPHVALRSDAKYCPSDRLLRVLLYAGTKFARAKSCRACRSAYMPMHARDLSHCGICESLTRPAAGPFELIACAFCGNEGHPALRHSPVRCCIVCAKDPDTRPLVIKALRKGRRQRLKEHSNA